MNNSIWENRYVQFLVMVILTVVALLTTGFLVYESIRTICSILNDIGHFAISETGAKCIGWYAREMSIGLAEKSKPMDATQELIIAIQRFTGGAL